MPKYEKPNTLYCDVFEANYKEGDCSYNGVYIASNGKVYFTINSHVLTYGVRIYETDPTTGETKLFWDGANDLPDLQEAHVPQGKIHCPLAELNGSIICATHTGWYVEDHRIHDSNFALKPYKGGYVLAIDMKTGKSRVISKPFADYPITFSFKGGMLPMLGEAVITAIFDKARGLFYGISFPKARFAKVDVTTGETTIYPSLQASGETVNRYLDADETLANPNYQWILRTLALDDKGNVYGCNGKGEIWQYNPDTDQITTMKSRIEDAVGVDDYEPLFYQNQWRTLLWDDVDKVFYGIQWGNSWLFKFDPLADKIEPIRKWVPDVAMTMDNKQQMGFLGLAMGPNHTLYGFRHVPAPKGSDDLTLHLLTYNIDNQQFKDNGSIKTTEGYSVLYAESCAVTENGDVYTVAWVDAPEEQRTWSEERRKKGVFSDVLQPYVMQLVKVPSNNIHF
jgi:hypothetical protein